jgi:hypothetical protein
VKGEVIHIEHCLEMWCRPLEGAACTAKRAQMPSTCWQLFSSIFFFNLCKYQIAPKPTLLKKNIIKRPKKLSILVVDHFSQPGPTCQIVSVLGLTALMDLFLMTTRSPKTCPTSQQPTVLIRPTTKSSPTDVGYYNSPLSMSLTTSSA